METSRSGRVLAAVFALAMFGSCGADDPASPPAPPARTIPVTVGSVVIHAEYATTLAERSQGLMGRTSLPDTTGMLFVFAVDQTLSFWMKDTPLDLAIAFVDSERRIINIVEMKALDEVTYHLSAAPARYALEMRAKWFSDRNITPGTTLTFTLPPGLVIDP